MMRFIISRALQALPVFFIVITAVFFMVRFVPGGPFDKEKPVSKETLAALNSYYGLDKPLGAQYVKFLGNLAHGNLGPSYKYQGRMVGELILEKSAVSAKLGAAALLLALFIGLLCGVMSACLKNRRLAEALDAFSMLGICLPAFVLGPLLIYVFSLKLGWFNAMGLNYPSDIVLPSITLALFYCAWIAKLSKNSMSAELKKDYVRTQRAKGAAESSVRLSALRSALMPVASYLAPAAAGLLTGSFVVESIFQIPGIGRFFISSALDSDYTMIMGCVMLYSALIIVFNILADIALALLNPKIAKEMRSK